MARLTKDELQKRKAELSQDAREELAKTEVMRFRLDPKSILRLCELAGNRRQHVSAMVRAWVMERLDAETASPISTPSAGRKSALNTGRGTSKAITFDYGNQELTTILNRLEYLETAVRRLAKHK